MTHAKGTMKKTRLLYVVHVLYHGNDMYDLHTLVHTVLVPVEVYCATVTVVEVQV